jgi:phospholipid/cholesterol/gamma-HCH transport system permease protein
MKLLGEIGDMMILTGKTMVSTVKPPYTYGNEFAIQFMFAIRLCWLPLFVTSVCVNYAVPGVQGGGFAEILGSLDRLGSFYSLADIREFAPFVCAIIVSGVAGTAITADLGARKIREELDALQVLGVDPVKNLVVPRFLALMLATALFDIFAIATGILGGVIATITHHVAIGPFFAMFWANGSTTDVWGSLVKCTLFGSITAIVCCYKGMTTSGGAEGVGRAVNQAVVISLLAVGSFNYVFTQTLLATHPDMMVLK